MPGGLDSCISSVYEDGNIAASSGIPPVRVMLPPTEDPDDFDPDDVDYSLNYLKFWNSGYLLLLMVDMVDNVDIKNAAGATVPAAAYQLPDGSFAPKVQVLGYEYETVAASQTDQVLGATGGTADLINGVLVVPATTSPGAVSIKDGSTSITIFAGGATSVSNLVPFFIPLGIRSVSGSWKLTTGAAVSCIAVGDFA